MLVVGDSVTFGWRISAETAFPAQLEREIQGSAEVLNLGVSGYNTGPEVRLAELPGPRLKPKVNLLAHLLNDPDRFTADHVRYFHPPVSELGYYLQRAAAKLHERLAGLEYHHYLHQRCGAEPPLHLRRLGKTGEHLGAQVTVAIVPVFDWTEAGYSHSDLHQLVERKSRSAGLEVVDLRSAFAGSAARDVSLDVWHPNTLERKLIANQVSGALHSRNLVPAGPQ